MADFLTNYRAVCTFLQSREHTPESLDPEDALVAEFCCLDLPIENLMAITDNRAFMRNCYYKLLGRAPSIRDVEQLAPRMNGATERNNLIQELLNSGEYRGRGIRVQVH